MKQKVVTVFTGTDIRLIDYQKDIDRYLQSGWVIKQISTAYSERAGIGLSIAVTLLLEQND
jgi:hypothetical protein